MGRYLPQLDGLRAIAALLVVALHLQLIRTGYIGVDIFFVLSGYLITTILLNESDRGDRSLKRFYVRRMRRLYPALSLMLLLTIPFDSVIIPGTPAHRWLAVGAAATYTSVFPTDFISIGWMGGLAHTWSLSIEELFYLLWPIGLAWLLRHHLQRLTYLLAAVLLVGLLLVPSDLLHCQRHSWCSLSRLGRSFPPRRSSC